MSHTRNHEPSTPRPTASNLIGQGRYTPAHLTTRRNVLQRHINKRVLFWGSVALASMAAVAGASIQAGGGRPLAHEAKQGVTKQADKIGDAFAHPTGTIEGEPSLDAAAHTAQVNEAENRAHEIDSARRHQDDSDQSGSD